MNEKLLLEELKKFKKLAGLPLLNEGGGEQGLARLIIGLSVKSGEKYFPREVGEIMVKRGPNQLKMNIKVEYYESLMKKELSAMTSEEKDIIRKIHSNVVENYGSAQIVNYIRNFTKDLDNASRIFVQRRLSDELFDTETSNIIKSELKGETAVVSNTSQNLVNKVDNELNNPAYDVISAQQKAEIERSINEAIQARLKTIEQQIKLYEKMNDAEFKKLKQEIDNQIAQMDAKTKEQLQPVIVRTQTAIKEAEAAKAEADLAVKQAQAEEAKAQAQGKKSKNTTDTIKNSAEASTAVAKSTLTWVQVGVAITVLITATGAGYAVLKKLGIWDWLFGGSSSNNSNDGDLKGALNQ